MPEDHRNCKKKTRWYQTCNHVWENLKILNAETRKQKNLDNYGLSDLMDDLIAEKREEVLSRIQNFNQNQK